MTSQGILIDSEQQRIADAKRFKRIKILVPMQGLLSGSSTTLDGSYMNYFLTDIYHFPVAFTGLLSIVTVVLAWVVGPVFAAFSDRFRFKNSKFWPWPVMAFSVKHLALIAVMVLPAFSTANTAVLAPVAFAIILVSRLTDKIGNVPVSGMAPLITKSPADRQFLAQSTKIGHEAGKAIWGYFVPLCLLAFTALAGDDRIKGFAISAIVLYAIGWTGPIVYALFGIKGSYMEREAMKQTDELKREKIPLSQTMKVLFTNRPVLGMFLFFTLHKICFFIYTIYSISVYDHIFGHAEAVGTFLTIFSFASVAGVLCGRLWTKIFKDSKRSCVMAMVAHIVFTFFIAITFNKVSVNIFLVLIAFSSFFMGMLETWVSPLFTACAEYGSWKTGVTMNALVLSTSPLSVTTASALPPVIATALLRPDNYNHGLTLLFVWAPLFLALAALMSLVLIFNLNDKKISQIQKDLSEGKVMATSDITI